MMASVALKQPILAIDAKEARILADAVIDVGRQYSVVVDPKVMAWINLALAGVSVYGPKIFYMMNQRKIPAQTQASPMGQQGQDNGTTGSAPPIKFE